MASQTPMNSGFPRKRAIGYITLSEIPTRAGDHISACESSPCSLSSNLKRRDTPKIKRWVKTIERRRIPPTVDHASGRPFFESLPNSCGSCGWSQMRQMPAADNRRRITYHHQGKKRFLSAVISFLLPYANL